MTDPIGPAATLPETYTPPAPSAATTQNQLGIDPEAFLQLLVTQLKYQDPTNPVDTSKFMNQTAMLTQVQTMTQMSTTLTDLVAAQQTASATGMIGRAVSFLDPDGNQAVGLVDSVSMHSGTAMLHVGDLAVPLAGVLEIANPVPVDGGGMPDDGTADVGGVDGGGVPDPVARPDDNAAGSDAPGTDLPSIDPDPAGVTDPDLAA